MCVSVRLHIPFRILTSSPSVTDGKSIGDRWKVESNFWKIYVTLRLNCFALYQRWGTQTGVMLTRVLLHGAVVQWRYKLVRWKALGEYFGVLQLWKEIGEVRQSYGACRMRENVQIRLETRIERWGCARECDWVRNTVTYACVCDAYVGKWKRGQGHEGQSGEGSKAVWTKRDGEETLNGGTGAACNDGGVQGAANEGREDEGGVDFAKLGRRALGGAESGGRED